MTVHLIHTTRHNPRPHMSEARRQHINGPLAGWSDLIDARPAGEPHPLYGVAILAAVLTMAAGYAVAWGAL